MAKIRVIAIIIQNQPEVFVSTSILTLQAASAFISKLLESIAIFNPMPGIKKTIAGWVTRLADRYGSKPDKERIHSALTGLHNHILQHPGEKGPMIKFNRFTDKFIIFSDQHKGAKNAADDFANCEPNYLAALDYYFQNGFRFISLGDCEELWENTLSQVVEANKLSFDREQKFVDNDAFIKVFGNHDLFWDNALTAKSALKDLYNRDLPIFEGVILQTEDEALPLQIFLTHGHQGDLVADGNAFSKWFISNIWGKIQGYLQINPNTPAYDDKLKTEHNKLMYEWSAGQPNLLLVTGHTHQPVFESLTHLERLYRLLGKAKENGSDEEAQKLTADITRVIGRGDHIPEFSAYQPCYFNSGCCCFADGDITGLEIEGGLIRLIRWKLEGGVSARQILEQIEIAKCIMT